MSVAARTGGDEADRLRAAVAAVQERGSATADLPPLAAGAHDAARDGLRLLRVRARSRYELRGRLVDKDHSSEDVEEALDRLEAWGLLDDRDFAAEWVRGRRRRRGKAAGALRRELEAKGVAADVVAGALEHLDPESEREHAVELVRARLERLGASATDDPAERERSRRRLIGFLERRGFATGVAVGVVRDALSESVGHPQGH